MSSQSRILALDIGASKLTLAEFSIGKGSAGPVLLNYSSAPRPSAESAGTFADLAPVVQSLMTDMGVRPAPLVVLLPGQSVFPRFFKLATAAADMVDQMVQEEAAQNLPFNLDQIVWDYEKLRENEAGELEALIVATKVETAEDVASLANTLALPLERVEAGPLALYNAVHAQVADLEGCTLVLDMGSKTTDLLFVEGGKVFMRTIPVAGGAITNEIVRSTGASFEDAEAYKIESGYVALGGTYGNPDDEQAEHVSKIIRNVVTRLHAEVTRSINFYRSQQGGSAPSRILLTGGSALLRYLDTFFREKLGVDVFLFNPFDGNSIAPQLGENSQAWGVLASLTGVALSHSGKGVLSINLVPPAIIAEQRLTRRIPFFIAGAVCFIAAMVCWLLFAAARADIYTDNEALTRQRINRLKSFGSEIEKTRGQLSAVEAEEQFYASAAFSRASFAKMLDAVQGAMLRSTWLTGMSYAAPAAAAEVPDNAPPPAPGSESGETPSYGTLTLSIAGFKGEMDALTTRGSPAEMFVSRLEKTGYFVPGASVVRTDGSDHKERIANIVIQLRLARPMGVFNPVWIDAAAPAGPAAEEAPAEDTPADEAAAEPEADETAAEAPEAEEGAETAEEEVAE